MYLVKLQTGFTFTSKGICSLCIFYKEKKITQYFWLPLQLPAVFSAFPFLAVCCLCSCPPDPLQGRVEGSWEGLGLVGNVTCSMHPCLPEIGKKGGLSLLNPPLHPLLSIERFWLDHKKTTPSSSVLRPFLLLGASRVTRFCLVVQTAEGWSPFLWPSITPKHYPWEAKQEKHAWRGVQISCQTKLF